MMDTPNMFSLEEDTEITNSITKDIIECHTIDDVITQIKYAALQTPKKNVRVVGAGHSVPDAIFASPREINIKLKLVGDLRKVSSEEENKAEGYLKVTVGAGCNLGVDPSDKNSCEENSFNRIFDRKGYALPILGGISHQTIGGFMMTSTAGGSLKNGFADVLESFNFVDGTGRLQQVHKGSDEFNASAVSMGLFGVVTHVTLKLQKNYLVRGTEETVSREDSLIRDATTLKQSLYDNEYFHCMWFPAKDVNRVIQFFGKQVDYKDHVEDKDKYHHMLENDWKMNCAGLLLMFVNIAYYGKKKECIQRANYLLKKFNTLGKREFCDYWYTVLPNDDKVLVDSKIKIQFTEIWIDIKYIELVIKSLNDLFDKNPQAAGNFGVELYGAKRSPFWMSPSFETDVVRVDAYWYEYNLKGNQYDFFRTYWDTLLTIPTARLHWGKHFPKIGTKFKNGNNGKDISIGPEYNNERYTKFKDWMKLRQQYDPNQIFVTSYWRKLFGIV